MSPRGEDWYRSRIAAGHVEWATVPGSRARRMPTLEEEDWLPLDVLVDVADPEADTFEQACLDERVSQMRAALDKLHLRERHVLLRIYENDWTYDWIAGELGISRERVRQIRVHAEKRLCGLLHVPS